MSAPPAQMAQQGQQRVPLAAVKNPMAIKLATALRYNALLKQRQGILTNTKNHADFFRYKRFVRAIQSDEYKKLQSKKPQELPAINPNDETIANAEIQKLFVLLIQNQLVVPVTKLKTKVAKSQGIKVTKTTPALEISNKAVLQPDIYYAWNYTPPNPYMLLYSILGIIVVFTVILFPLWPLWMRKGVWYLSTALLGLIGVFFGIAIIRLILYLITLATMSRQFWLFPNLFEDCGVLESFQPFYGWEDPKSKGGKKKRSKTKNVVTTEEKSVDIKPVETTNKENKSTSVSANQTTATTKSRVILEDVTDE